MREQPRYRINHFIRIPELQLIDESGKPHGVVPTSQALKMAQEAGFDLVEVNPAAKPPIAKIMDFGQFQYKQQKLLRAQKTKVKRVEIKGVRISFKIGEHDRAVRLRAASRFLDEGHKVRVEMVLRGRERAHLDMAQDIIRKFVAALGADVVVEVPFSRQGGRLSLQVGRKKGAPRPTQGPDTPVADDSPTTGEQVEQV
ncbi:MAG: translation initiation factor IF-3 [Candidatus Veblenbacteria bacterium]|nr:translation initiation factor IF-3 [Candidatus Veblenbacteria bacterium]MDZ4230006.1 translation initiation factor IF-3 [Candidatus Veblenbacteria bacterium]